MNGTASLVCCWNVAASEDYVQKVIIQDLTLKA